MEIVSPDVINSLSLALVLLFGAPMVPANNANGDFSEGGTVSNELSGWLLKYRSCAHECSLPDPAIQITENMRGQS